jgi:hypothetical protein
MAFSDFGSKSNPTAIGLHRLIEEFGLEVVAPSVRSEAIRGARKTRITEGAVLEQYPLSYGPTDLFGHLRFAMRYEPIDLNVLVAFFGKVDRQAFEAWVKSEPVGKYARRAWYLYELLTGETLDLPDVPPTDNVLLLNPALHITATGVRVRRQRVIDNLLGNRDYCPMFCWHTRSTTCLPRRPNHPSRLKARRRVLTGRVDLWLHLAGPITSTPAKSNPL